jgi:integrase/recombinase XerD
MKTYIDIGEVRSMEEAADNQRDRLLNRLLFRLGCRISEALAIAVNNVDFRNGTVTIQHLKSRLRLSCPSCGARLGRCHRFCPSCGGPVKEVVTRATEHRRVRILPVDDETLKMMKDYIAAGGPVIRNGRALLFGINRHRAWQIVRLCSEKAGIPHLVNPETGRIRGVSPHRLRDAFAVHAVKTDDSGDGLRMLQEQLGHASFNTTAKYRKVGSEEHREWYQRLWENGRP